MIGAFSAKTIADLDIGYRIKDRFMVSIGASNRFDMVRVNMAVTAERVKWKAVVDLLNPPAHGIAGEFCLLRRRPTAGGEGVGDRGRLGRPDVCARCAVVADHDLFSRGKRPGLSRGEAVFLSQTRSRARTLRPETDGRFALRV